MKKLKHEAELVKGAILAGVKYGEERGAVEFEPTDAASEKILYIYRLLVHDKGPLGLNSILANAGLPERLFPVARTALELIAETNYDGRPYDRERFIGKMIERLLTQFEGPESGLAEEEIDYLLDKLKDLAA